MVRLLIGADTSSGPAGSGGASFETGCRLTGERLAWQGSNQENKAKPTVTKSPKKSLGKRLVAFLSELERRKVVQTTLVYLLAAWGISAGAADIFGALGLPEWVAGYVVVGIFAMTPVVAALSWVYEVNKKGISRDYGPPDELINRDTEVARRNRRKPLTLTYRGQTQTFYRDVTVGRDESCSFQILEPLVSRRHVKFEFTDGSWHACDLGSANGTQIDGRELDHERLDGESTLVLYPDGPPLKVKVASEAESAKTQLAGSVGSG
jgi:hypothetical protein